MVWRKLVQADGDRETSLAALAHLMDSQFEVPVLGWRFGLNTLFDVVPGVGDAATSVVAIIIMLAGVRRGVSRATLLRMALNIVVYAVGGILPFVGDLFDTWWKPNRRNLDLLARARSDGPGSQHTDTAFVGLLVGLLLAVVLGCSALLVGITLWAWHSMAGLKP